MTLFHPCQEQLEPFFKKEDDLVFSSDVDGLMDALKAVLLHNGNRLPSTVVRHAVDMKETYDNLKQLLNFLQYSKYGWHLCCDLKVVALLMGLQLRFTKYCCFLYE